MKKLLITALALVLCVSNTSFAQTKKPTKAFTACPTVENINTNYVYKNSAPLRSGGEGTALVGFQEVPTLIMKKRGSARGLASVFDSNGNLLAKCGWKTATDFAGGRHKCGASTREMRRSALKQSKSPAGFFKINPRTCVKIPDLGKCYGSVKGKCNQTLG